MVFMVIGVIGALVLLLSLVIGDIGDVDFGHDWDFGADLFSIAALAGFAGAFGFGAALVESLTGQTWLGVLAGVLVGAVIAWLVARLTRALKTGGTAGTVRTSNLVGLEGVVLSSIPAGGFGEVRIRAHGQQLKLNARSEAALETGQRVWVSGVVSPTAVEVRDSDPLDSAFAPGAIES
ncbi:hypothetical protein [Aestuariimicrobium ganziense]|uniref:hypothetical protein n=1 Tax=Aestuariimicrobium ganziense TaxID=2773677 RepID=UPI001940D3DD|nr:hypothetical protein [Aestuariimicrobium ganziense]